MPLTRNLFLSFLTLILCSPLFAESKAIVIAEEIEQLITRVKQSEATFHRNGKTYSAAQAADHLRLKLQRGKKYAKTTEHFINQLASKSSWSGKAYRIELDNGTIQPMQQWLEVQLKEIRSSAEK